MPDNPYNNPITDKGVLRESSAKWVAITERYEKEYGINLNGFETFKDFIAFQKNHPQIPPIFPDQWLKDSHYEYLTRYGDRRGEWEAEKREQELKLYEGKRQQQPYSATQALDSAAGALGLAALPILNRLTLADTMQDDRRYKKTIKSLAKNWQSQNPKEKLWLINTLPNGTRVPMLNPKLLQTMPDIHEQAEKEFESKHPIWARRYRAKEARTIYDDHLRDPAYQRLQKKINQQVVQNFRGYAPGTAPGITTIRQSVTQREYDDFVRRYPKKARAYSKFDPHMKKHFDTWDWQRKQNRFSRRLFRKLTGRPSPTTPPPKKRGLKQRVRDWYDDKKKKLKQLARRYAAQRGRKVAWNATKAAGRGSWRAVSRGGGPVIRGGGRAAKRAAGGIGRSFTRMFAGASRQLLMGGLRLAGAFIVANIWWILLALLIIILIVGAIVIIMALIGDNNSSKGQVTVTKSVDKQMVNNPPTPETPSEDITYTISATYGGTATDIIITDAIDKNAKFISATGNYSFDGTTITWHTNQQGITPTPAGPTSTPAPSGTTPAPTTPPTSAGSASSGTFTLVVRPITPNTYIINQAFAQAIDSGSGPGPTGPGIPNTGQCADPPDGIWPDVNRWDPQILQAIATIEPIENVTIPCNLIKAFMHLESGGQELPPNVDGYLGLMQVGPSSATGGGSDCDLGTYDVYSTQGNLDCGVQVIARGLKACNNDLQQAIGRYFTGRCDYWNAGPDSFGTTPQDYVDTVINLYNYLNNYVP